MERDESMSAPEYRQIVAVDFDGTLAETKFPEIIKPIPKMIKYCKQLQKSGGDPYSVYLPERKRPARRGGVVRGARACI